MYVWFDTLMYTLILGMQQLNPVVLAQADWKFKNDMMVDTCLGMQYAHHRYKLLPNIDVWSNYCQTAAYVDLMSNNLSQPIILDKWWWTYCYMSEMTFWFKTNNCPPGDMVIINDTSCCHHLVFLNVVDWLHNYCSASMLRKACTPNNVVVA
jgi:hypothetical protein